MPRREYVHRISKHAGHVKRRPDIVQLSNVLMVGMTYKPDIADVRESAAIRVFEEVLFVQILHRGFHLRVFASFYKFVRRSGHDIR